MSAASNGQRPGGMRPGPMGRGGWGAMGMPVQKAKDFKGTAKRLLGYFMPQKYLLLLVFCAAIMGTVFNIIGPKILGLATTRLFEGLLAKFRVFQFNQLHPQHPLPVPGIDFTYIGNILLLLIGLYVISSLFQYLQQYI